MLLSCAQVQELLSDLQQAFDSGQEHFLGAIVTTRRGESAGEPYWVRWVLGHYKTAANIGCKQPSCTVPLQPWIDFFELWSNEAAAYWKQASWPLPDPASTV